MTLEQRNHIAAKLVTKLVALGVAEAAAADAIAALSDDEISMLAYSPLGLLRVARPLLGR